MVIQDIKLWRRDLRITQDQAAFLLGISRVGLQQREKGSVPIIPETWYALSYLAEHPEEVTARLKDYLKSV